MYRISCAICKRFGFYLSLDIEKNPNVWIFCGIHSQFIHWKNNFLMGMIPW